MKSKSRLLIYAMLAMQTGLAASLLAQAKPRTAGIGLRAGYWDMNSGPAIIRIVEHSHQRLIEAGGASGWLNFFSRTGDSWFMEFSLGGTAKMVEEYNYFDGQDTRVLAVVPVLLGMRYQFLPPSHPGAMRPYLAFGGGPYWVADIFTRERYHRFGAYEEEISINSKIRPGGYVGGGLDFMLLDWLGLNFDVKYHFVNFDSDDEFSGYEYGLGIQFMWGNYRPGRRQ